MLQIGSLFDSRHGDSTTRRFYSYNDGNFAQAVQSPFFPKGISSRRIDATTRHEIEVASTLDRVFTMSEYLRQSFIGDYGVPEERVINIGAGINLDSLPVQDPEKDYESAQAMFIGVDFERKGGRDVVAAFAAARQRVPRAVLHVVGPRNPIPDVAAVDGVVWHGFLDKGNPQDAAQLESLFLRASLFVMPSLYEPFGIAPLEAMAYGVPCVVSDAWALPEIVPAGKCGLLVPPGDREALAEALTSLLKEPAKLQRYGQEGIRHVRERFTWPRTVARLRAALEAVG